MVSGPGPALRHRPAWSDAPQRSQALPDVPRRRQDASKKPPRRPRGPQDRSKTPKMTPKASPRGLMLEPRELQKTNKNQLFLRGVSRIQPLPFIFCSMLIKNGLKISSRSLQERSKNAPRCPKTSNGLQHGANMGSKRAPRSVQGGSNCSPEGVTSSDCSPTAHMDPTWTPNAPQMNPKLGSCWDHLGVILGSYWGHLGVTLGSL